MKTAVVLFNLGGPDSPAAVKPFLFNLFNDPAIIGAPGPIRWALAKYISAKRAPVAREIYSHLGGSSPLLPQTRDQAAALEKALGNAGTQDEFKTFIAMRYWHPMTEQTVSDVKRYAPDQVLLLPLYPQYSRTTSGSSLKAWKEEAARQGLTAPMQEVCCWPTLPGFTQAMAIKVKAAIEKTAPSGKPRILFSAHGLPKKVIEGGDPYQWQVEQTAAAIVAQLDVPSDQYDWQVCYQSRVGPLEWIGPSTDDEIARGGQDGVPLIVVPLAFVSEHSETLVELDIEYRELAHEKKVPAYERVETVQSDPIFITDLARLVGEACGGAVSPCSHRQGRLCPNQWSQCPNKAEPV